MARSPIPRGQSRMRRRTRQIGRRGPRAPSADQDAASLVPEVGGSAGRDRALFGLPLPGTARGIGPRGALRNELTEGRQPGARVTCRPMSGGLFGLRPRVESATTEVAEALLREVTAHLRAAVVRGAQPRVTVEVPAVELGPALARQRSPRREHVHDVPGVSGVARVPRRIPILGDGEAHRIAAFARAPGHRVRIVIEVRRGGHGDRYWRTGAGLATTLPWLRRKLRRR
jgi:hypothetical protein